MAASNSTAIDTEEMQVYIAAEEDKQRFASSINFKDIVISFVGWLCEMVTVCGTINYMSLQLDSALLLHENNGFCLPHLFSHLWCAAFDVFVWMLAEDSRQRISVQPGQETTNKVISFSLFMHVVGHLYLFVTQPHDATIVSINTSKHWSFTWVLLFINLGYCLPRLLLYPPTDTTHRAAPHYAVKSCGICILMQLASVALVDCDSMRILGGHLVYDLTIAVVALSHMYLLEYDSNKKEE